MHAVGSVLEKVVVSNLLNFEGVAPRVYDLIVLQSKNGPFHYAFVVQHIDGPVVHGEDGINFIGIFKTILEKLGMETISISDHCDLRPPYFRDNIVRNSNGMYYVDIQNFVLKNSSIMDRTKEMISQHFEADQFGKFINTKRFFVTNRESNQICKINSTLSSLFEEAHIDLNENIVVNLQNGLGLLGICLLSIGALWAFLMTEKEKDHLLSRFYHLHGFTRFDTFSEISKFHDILRDYKFIHKKYLFICDSSTINFIEEFRYSGIENLLFVSMDDDGSKNDNAYFGYHRISSKSIQMNHDSKVFMTILRK